MTGSTDPGVGAAPEPPAVEAAARAPDFFIVGHQKTGTTALYEMLRRHPQIFMPEMKELWFLSPELRSRFRSRVGKRPETLEQYLAMFAAAGPGQRVGEASPSYLMSETAAGRIAELQPDARIIAILREPASFLRSFHLQCVQNHIETEKDFRKAIELEEARRQGRKMPSYSARPHELLYSGHIRYVEQLRRYHEVFGRERVLVLIYDDFLDDNEETVRRVLRLLDLDDSYEVESVRANPTVGVRSQRLHELIRSLYLGRGSVSRGVKAGVKALTSQRLRRDALRATRRKLVYRAPPPPDEQLMLELRRRFKGEVVALSEYLDRDLVSLWGYDHLG